MSTAIQLVSCPALLTVLPLLPPLYQLLLALCNLEGPVQYCAMISLLDAQGALADRLREIVDRPENGYADVTFSVSGQTFGGLRSTLGLHSEVMQRMLFGEFLEARKQAPIQLEQFDHAPGPFREFLHFMHTGKAVMDDMTDLSEMLEIAKYFGVTALIDCILDNVRKASWGWAPGQGGRSQYKITALPPPPVLGFPRFSVVFLGFPLIFLRFPLFMRPM